MARGSLSPHWRDPMHYAFLAAALTARGATLCMRHAGVGFVVLGMGATPVALGSSGCFVADFVSWQRSLASWARYSCTSSSLSWPIPRCRCAGRLSVPGSRSPGEWDDERTACGAYSLLGTCRSPCSCCSTFTSTTRCASRRTRYTRLAARIGAQRLRPTHSSAGVVYPTCAGNDRAKAVLQHVRRGGQRRQ